MYHHIRAKEELASYKLEDTCHLAGEVIPDFPINKIRQFKRKSKGSMQMALFTLKKAYVPLAMMGAFYSLKGYIREARKQDVQNTLKQALKVEMMENESRGFENSDSDEYSNSLDYFEFRRFRW